MILIISQSRNEPSTEDVIDWLYYNNIPFYRINGIDVIKKIKIEISNENFTIDLPELDWSIIDAIWFRRWFSFQDIERIFLKARENKNGSLASQFNENLRSELRALTTFFLEALPKEKLFCLTQVDELNKLTVLKKASELGILIPRTAILTDLRDLINLKARSRVITKAIDNVDSIEIGNQKFLGYTAEVETYPERVKHGFSPSLFQNLIDKKFEIRSFLLRRNFYSMAIFSQQDRQTQIDFRKYNHDDPNRVVPFKLPAHLEEKLIRLAEYFGLQTGSFDLIKTNDGEYVFLEINPGGQFGMVSYPCNYFLEKKLAKELSIRK